MALWARKARNTKKNRLFQSSPTFSLENPKAFLQVPQKDPKSGSHHFVRFFYESPSPKLVSREFGEKQMSFASSFSPQFFHPFSTLLLRGFLPTSKNMCVFLSMVDEIHDPPSPYMVIFFRWRSPTSPSPFEQLGSRSRKLTGPQKGHELRQNCQCGFFHWFFFFSFLPLVPLKDVSRADRHKWSYI